jgi:hypothetical protein
MKRNFCDEMWDDLISPTVAQRRKLESYLNTPRDVVAWMNDHFNLNFNGKLGYLFELLPYTPGKRRDLAKEQCLGLCVFSKDETVKTSFSWDNNALISRYYCKKSPNFEEYVYNAFKKGASFYTGFTLKQSGIPSTVQCFTKKNWPLFAKDVLCQRPDNDKKLYFDLSKITLHDKSKYLKYRNEFYRVDYYTAINPNIEGDSIGLTNVWESIFSSGVLSCRDLANISFVCRGFNRLILRSLKIWQSYCDSHHYEFFNLFALESTDYSCGNPMWCVLTGSRYTFFYNSESCSLGKNLDRIYCHQSLQFDYRFNLFRILAQSIYHKLNLHCISLENTDELMLDLTFDSALRNMSIRGMFIRAENEKITDIARIIELDNSIQLQSFFGDTWCLSLSKDTQFLSTLIKRGFVFLPERHFNLTHSQKILNVHDSKIADKFHGFLDIPEKELKIFFDHIHINLDMEESLSWKKRLQSSVLV